jgi:hypothetical protein
MHSTIERQFGIAQKKVQPVVVIVIEKVTTYADVQV